MTRIKGTGPYTSEKCPDYCGMCGNRLTTARFVAHPNRWQGTARFPSQLVGELREQLKEADDALREAARRNHRLERMLDKVLSVMGGGE